MNVRFAQVEDIPTLSSMYREMFKDISQLQPNDIREADEDPDFIKNVIESVKDQIFIAENEKGEVCGFCTVLYQSTPPKKYLISKNLLYIDALFVRHEARKQGVAQAITSSIQAYGKQLEVDYIEVAVLPNNNKSIQLHERLNFHTSLLKMRFDM